MKLSEADITKRFRNLRSWQRNNDVIERTFEFATFAESIKFVNEIAKIAEAMNHHPDVDIRFSSVTLSLSTHSEGGLTGKDFDLAEKIDKFVNKKD